MAVDMTETIYAVESDSQKFAESLFHPYAAQAATDNGDWVDAKGWESIVANVTIADTATVSINGSNAATEPLNTAHGFVLATALTATGVFEIQPHEMPRWVKVYVSVWSAGNVDVDMKVRKRIMDLHGS